MEPKTPHHAIVPEGFPVKGETLSGEEIAYANALLHAQVGTRHALISERTRTRTGVVYTVVRVDVQERRLFTVPEREFGYCEDERFRPLVVDEYGRKSADPKHYLNISRVLHPLAPLKFVVHPPTDQQLKPLRGGPTVLVPEPVGDFDDFDKLEDQLDLDYTLEVREAAQAAARFAVISQYNSGGHVVGT